MKLTLGPKAWAQWHPGSVAELLPWYVRLGILSSCGLYEIVVGSRGLVLRSHSTMVPTETLRIKEMYHYFVFKEMLVFFEGLSGRSSKHLRTTCASHLPSLSTWAWRCGFQLWMSGLKHWLVRVGSSFHVFVFKRELVMVELVRQFIWDIHTFYINCFVEFCPSIVAHKGDETLKTEGGEIYVGSFLGEWNKDERLFLLERFVPVLTSVWRQFELATLFERETWFFSERNMHGTWFKIISRRSLDLQWSTVYDRQVCSFSCLFPSNRMAVWSQPIQYFQMSSEQFLERFLVRVPVAFQKRFQMQFTNRCSGKLP